MKHLYIAVILLSGCLIIRTKARKLLIHNSLLKKIVGDILNIIMKIILIAALPFGTVLF
jgi:hypothetical protein